MFRCVDQQWKRVRLRRNIQIFMAPIEQKRCYCRRCHWFRWIEQIFLYLCCSICSQIIIFQLNGSFKLRKGLITSDLLLLLCARETVLKVLVEKSEFLINFDRYFLINMLLSLQALMYRDIYPMQTMKIEIVEHWTRFLISGSRKGLHCNQAVIFLRKFRGSSLCRCKRKNWVSCQTKF